LLKDIPVKLLPIYAFSKKEWPTHLFAQKQSCQTSARLCVFNKGMADSPICSKTVLSNICPSTCFQQRSNQSPICSKTVLSNICPSTCFQQRSNQLTYLLKDSPVKHLPIYRVLLYLPVTSMHNVAVLAAQNETAAVRDRVCHPQWRAPEASKTPGMLPAIHTHTYITVLVFRTHEGSQQTITVRIQRMSDLNDKIHAKLF